MSEHKNPLLARKMEELRALSALEREQERQRLARGRGEEGTENAQSKKGTDPIK